MGMNLFLLSQFHPLVYSSSSWVFFSAAKCITGVRSWFVKYAHTCWKTNVSSTTGPQKDRIVFQASFFRELCYYLRWVYILWTPTKPAQDEVQPVGILRDVWWSFSDSNFFKIFKDRRQTSLDMVIRRDYHPKHYLWLSIKILQITLDNSWVISTKILQIILANFWK